MVRLLGLGVLAAVGFPLARLLLSPTLRPALRGHRDVTLALVAVLGGYLAAVGAVAAYAPPALPWLAGAAAIGLAASAWRGRASYGRSRGLPPGSLALSASVRSLLDDRFYLRQATRHGPVFKTSQFHRRSVCVLGLDRAARLLRDHEDDLMAPELPLNRSIRRGFLRYMSAADHARYAPVFQAAFSREVIRRCEPVVRARLRAALDALAAKSVAEGDGVDPRAELEQAVFDVLCRVCFGVTSGPALERLEAAYRDVDFGSAEPGARDRSVRCIADVGTVLRETALEGAGGDAPSTSILAELVRVQPDALDDPTVVGNLTFILNVAHSNVSGLLLWLLEMLGDHPEWVARMRALDGEAAADLAHRIVHETLRLEQSEFLYRVAQRPVRIDRFTIPAGWFIRICVRESHRSAATFENPERFDPDRFREGMPPKTQYAPFGMGRHACIGGFLTLTVGHLLVEEITRGYTWSIVSSGARRRLRLRHWSHWTPGSDLRVRIGR